jgi:hypothetical protein
MDESTDSVPTADIPAAIWRYQDAHDRHDTDRALSAFAPEATVVDEDREYHGTEEIRHWLETAGREFTYKRTLLSARAIDAATWVIHNRLEGNFPGNIADLRYHFTLSGSVISRLVIAP